MDSTAGGSKRVMALELAVAFSEDDLQTHRGALESLPSIAQPLPPNSAGYRCAGSFAARNIELIYTRAAKADKRCGLEAAVRACFETGMKHVLVCSGFFVLHDRCGPPAAQLAPGSCETDGPLGALAVVRAFASRGICVSLFCDLHTGPVLKAGYDAMLQHFAAANPSMAEALLEYSRCLPFVADVPSVECSAACEELLQKAFERPTEAARRMASTAINLRGSLQSAWDGQWPGDVQCLIALERLGAPYRNIRGIDISEHTEPIDCLWPMLAVSADEVEAGKVSPDAASCIQTYMEQVGISGSTTSVLREAAGVRSDALCLGVGDGGNEVGMGKVALLAEIAGLVPPGGAGDYAALSQNGCFRTCDHLILATVSNWGGSAFELAAELVCPAATDYLPKLVKDGGCLADLEELLLRSVMAPPACAVDPVAMRKPSAQDVPSVDGMPFDPNHRQLYDHLWSLAFGAE